jgi:hypothetical protein
VPEEDGWLYDSEQILSITSRLRAELSNLARAIVALTSDRTARQRYLDNAGAGALHSGFAPIEERADPLVRLVAGYDYLSPLLRQRRCVEEVKGNAG